MKKILCFFFILFMGIVFKACLIPSLIDCTWQHNATVHLLDNYLELPCGDDCFNDADYAVLLSYFGKNYETSLYDVMTAPNMGYWDSSHFLWVVSADNADCTELSREEKVEFNQNSSHRFYDFRNSFYEAPRSNNAQPWGCKHHYELTIRLYSGMCITWQKDWFAYSHDKFCSDYDTDEIYHVALNGGTIKPEVYNRGKRNVYMNNEFRFL